MLSSLGLTVWMFALCTITLLHCGYSTLFFFSQCFLSSTKHRVFLPAADIPSFVGKGNVDLGITGHDVILEAGMSEHVTELLRLGFGKCALQVFIFLPAVPT